MSSQLPAQSSGATKLSFKFELPKAKSEFKSICKSLQPPKSAH